MAGNLQSAAANPSYCESISKQMRHFAFFLLVILLSWRLEAQNKQSAPPSIFEKLIATEAVELTLETDLTTFIGQKKTNNYLPGTLRTKSGKSYSVEVRPRGRYRRKVSQIPPMKLRFDGKGLKADSLNSFNEIKVAVPCFVSDEGDDLLVKEYLAYKMFEKYSYAHFRTGLVKLTLIDTNDKGSGKKKMYAIFIEDEEEVAHRLNGEPEESFGIKVDKLDAQQAAKVAMFQYLIGNTDWDFAMHRNVQLIKQKDGGKILALPYDFDFSGLVSAPYAVPSSESGLRNVRDRYLMAAGISPDALKAATKTLKEKEKEFYQVCRSKYISGEAEADMTTFLQSFFQNMKGKEEPPATMVMKKE